MKTGLFERIGKWMRGGKRASAKVYEKAEGKDSATEFRKTRGGTAAPAKPLAGHGRERVAVFERSGEVARINLARHAGMTPRKRLAGMNARQRRGMLNWRLWTAIAARNTVLADGPVSGRTAWKGTVARRNGRA